MSDTQIDVDFAKAWDKSSGYFSANIANRILQFGEQNNKKIKTALDICCGASNLLEIFHARNIKCMGTETRQGMIDYSREKLPEVNFVKTKKMSEVPKGKYDLVTCNHDIVNYFENFSEWEDFFKSVSKHLSGSGMFIFDFYTKNKLESWNETLFSSSDWLDFVTDVKSGIYDKTRIIYTNYIKLETHAIKTRDIVVECYFENEKIFEALKRAGFKNLMIVDENLVPAEDYAKKDRIHVIAMKK